MCIVSCAPFKINTVELFHGLEIYLKLVERQRNYISFYLFKAYNEPNNVGEDCVLKYKPSQAGVWNDIAGDSVLTRAICEIDVKVAGIEKLYYKWIMDFV